MVEILLSGGRMQNEGSLGITNSKVAVLSSRWQGLCPLGLLLPGLFLLFLGVVNSSSGVVCPLLQEKKQTRAAVYFMVTGLCACVRLQ